MSPPDPDQERRILQYGDEAVERPMDSVLDESAAAEPLKKGKRKKKKKKRQPTGKLVLITANGYSGYTSAEKEIQAIQGGFWMPHTEDFNATAAQTRNKIFRGASTADEFFGALQHASGPIARVVFVGHGSPGGLGLSGEPLDFFAETLDSSDIQRWQNQINDSIKPKFSKNAKMDLVACNVAIGKAFTSELAKALDICVRAFSDAVEWCVSFEKDPHEITSRGRIGPPSAKSKSCSNKAWSKGVNRFIPPVEVCP